MFPIGWMYYFGTNLENRFSVPDFWPEPGTTHKIPFEKEEQEEMLTKLKTARLERRRKRLQSEGQAGRYEQEIDGASIAVKELMSGSAESKDVQSQKKFKSGVIDRWASGKQ